MLGGEEELICKVLVNGTQLEHVADFKYLGYVLDELCTDDPKCCRKVVSGRKVMGTIGSLGNASNLSVQGCRMRHCLFMFNYMVVRQWYGDKRIDLGLGVCRLTTFKRFNGY